MPRGVPNPKPTARQDADETLVNADKSDGVTEVASLEAALEEIKADPDAVARSMASSERESAASYVELGEICRHHFPGGWSGPMASKSDVVTCEHDGSTRSWRHWVEVGDPE
jgi:hypothetical protein